MSLRSSNVLHGPSAWQVMEATQADHRKPIPNSKSHGKAREDESRAPIGERGQQKQPKLCLGTAENQKPAKMCQSSRAPEV